VEEQAQLHLLTALPFNMLVVAVVELIVVLVD
jgi:hypothetical protein